MATAVNGNETALLQGGSPPPVATSCVSVLKAGGENFEEIVCTLLLFIMVGSVCISVLYRYVLNAPLPWPEELARFALVWLTCFGAAAATKHKAHMAVDFAVSFFPSRTQRHVALWVGGIQIVFLIVYVVLGVQYVERMAVAISPGLSVNMAFVYLSLPLGGALMVVHLLRQFVARLRGCDRPGRS